MANMLKPQAMQLLGPDETVQQQQITRQQAMADMLRKQSMEPSGNTEMIGGWAVKKSPFEGLAKMAKALAGNYIGGKADESQTALAHKSRTQLADTLAGYTSDLQGKPAQDYPVTDDEYGAQTASAPAVAPNKQAALARLLQSSNPALQQFGLQQMIAKPDNPFGKVDAKDYTAASIGKFSTSQNFADLVPARKQEFINTGGGHVAVNPYETAPGSTIANTGDPYKDLLVAGPGGPVQNQPMVDARKAIQKAGASNIQNTVSVAGPENEYNKTVGKGLADASLALVDSAKGAPETIRNAQLIRSVLDKGAFTGTGANARLAVQKALETAGMVGEGRAADTQALMSGLSKLTLAGVKTSGLGAGNGFTDKDREFLQSAISGTIDGSPLNLRRMANLSERIAVANHKKGSGVLGRWQADPALRAVAQDSTIDNIPVQPSAAAPAGLTPSIKSLLDKYK